jgi:hypothetical protein
MMQEHTHTHTQTQTQQIISWPGVWASGDGDDLPDLAGYHAVLAYAI